MGKRQTLCEIGLDAACLFSEPFFDAAIIGTTSDDRVVYSFDKMVECLVKEGMEYGDAVEHIEYNTLRSLPYYPNSPVVLMNEERFSD